jgi:hypothetical protein
MKPPARTKTDFEKVKIGEFIMGTIDKVEYDMEHSFKGFEGKADTVSPAVRFIFKLQGYEFPHRSRWMRFTLGEKSNLYKKYVAKLVNNPKPDMEFDLDVFNGMQIKTIWDENGDYQNLDSIYPLGAKIDVTKTPTVEETPAPTEDDFIPEIEDGEKDPF